MKRKQWFAGYVVVCALAAAGISLAYWRTEETHARGRGKNLNRTGWESSYLERGLAVPATGPRAGYWGSRIGKTVRHPTMGWLEPPTSVPDLLDIGPNGFQRYSSTAEGAQKLTILGASVAFAGYASSIDRTYFSVLGRELERQGAPAEITVVAAGAWKSVQELAALREWGTELGSDVIVLLDGLNDLSNGATSATLYGERIQPADGKEWSLFYHTHDYEQRVSDYLKNMEKAADLAAELRAELVIVLQPSLVEREGKSPVEASLLEATLQAHTSAEALTAAYEAMRRGLAALATKRGIHFLDCSRLFNGERATTFADLWHFSDFGNELLGQAIAREVAPILEQRRHSKAEPTADGSR